MMTRISIRLAISAALVAVPMVSGCGFDTHGTATGLQKSKDLTPNDAGPRGSGSIDTYKVNAGGPGAPGTTAANPEK